MYDIVQITSIYFFTLFMEKSQEIQEIRMQSILFGSAHGPTVCYALHSICPLILPAAALQGNKEVIWHTRMEKKDITAHVTIIITTTVTINLMKIY